MDASGGPGVGTRRPGSGRLRDEGGFTLLELLVASFLGLLLLAAALHLLHGHAALALRVQADLEALDDGLWALDVLRADLRRAQVAWPGSAEEGGPGPSPVLLALAQDLDGDDRIDPNSAESVGWALSTHGPTRLLRRVGRQSMTLLDGVRHDSWRVAYFGPDGELLTQSPTGRASDPRVVRVWVAFGIERASTRIELRGAAAIPVQRGRS